MPEGEKGGEGYYREDFEKVDRDLEATKGEISPEKPTGEIIEAAQRKGGLEEKRGRMMEMAFDEALELNKQYNELWAQKEQAEQGVAKVDQEIAAFRREKLGMEEPKEAEKKERTRETEIQRNVEKWKVWARILELDITDEQIEAEVRTAIEAVPEEKAKELGPEVAYEVMLKGVSPSQMLKLAKEHSRYYEWDGMDEYFDTVKSPRSNQEKSYAIAYAFQQEPDEETLGEGAQSAEDLEKTDNEYMNLSERVLAGASWKQQEGSELDEKNWTQCAGSRTRDGHVPGVYYDSVYREVYVDDGYPRYRSPILGPRRVVSSKF